MFGALMWEVVVRNDSSSGLGRLCISCMLVSRCVTLKKIVIVSRKRYTGDGVDVDVGYGDRDDVDHAAAEDVETYDDNGVVVDDGLIR